MKTRFMNSFKTKIVLLLCFTLRHMIVESFTCGISSNCFGFIQKNKYTKVLSDYRETF